MDARRDDESASEIAQFQRPSSCHAIGGRLQRQIETTDITFKHDLTHGGRFFTKWFVAGDNCLLVALYISEISVIRGSQIQT